MRVSELKAMGWQDGDEEAGEEAAAPAPVVHAAPKQMRSENPDYRQHANDR